MLLQALGGGDKDTGRQRHIEDSVLESTSTLLNVVHSRIQLLVRPRVIVLARYVSALLQEFFKLLLLFIVVDLNTRRDALSEVVQFNVGSRVTDDIRVWG